MVTITGFKPRNNEMGVEFFVLVVEGGIEIVRSESGNTYFTSKKATVPTTYDAERCEMLIGHQLPGTVRKEKCEPYEYLEPETGDKMILDYQYVYESEAVSEEDAVFAEDENLV